jgi:uncharacterized damage-inducible protein DinB
MKEIFIQLASYNIWANNLLFDVIGQLSPELQNKEVSSSFPSLYKTVLHVWNAESIWWQRLKLQERIIAPAENFNGSFNELAHQVITLDRQWYDWINNAQEHMLQHVFLYQNTKREQFKQPVFQMLLHLFNHGTYHRGQLVTIMRELNITKIPATDFILWSRKR